MGIEALGVIAVVLILLKPSKKKPVGVGIKLLKL